MDAIVSGKVEEKYKVVSTIAGENNYLLYLKQYNENSSDDPTFYMNTLARIIDQENRIILFPVIDFIYLLNTTAQYLQFNLTLNKGEVIQPFYLSAVKFDTYRNIDATLICGKPGLIEEKFSTFVKSFDLVIPA